MQSNELQLQQLHKILEFGGTQMTTTTTKTWSSGDQRRIHQRHPHPQSLNEQRAVLPQNMSPFRMKAFCFCHRISFKTSDLFNQL